MRRLPLPSLSLPLPLPLLWSSSSLVQQSSSSLEQSSSSFFLMTKTTSRGCGGRLSSSSSPPPSSSSSFKRSCRLLDAARGYNYNNDQSVHRHHHKHRPLPVFPLRAKHFAHNNDYGPVKMTTTTTTTTGSSGGNNNGQSSSMTPNEFHRVLCQKIRTAQRRVLIASLYVGPAASPHTQHEEVELLDALRDVAVNNIMNSNRREGRKNVQVRVVLDENRALRPVPLSPSPSLSSSASSTTKNDDQAQPKTTTETATTSSAEAVADALFGYPDQPSTSDTASAPSSSSFSNPPPQQQQQLENGVYLFQVLASSPILKSLLPNPLDEVAGVFHIKAYIVDDELIISGANLSQEYFVDRQDRYLHLTNGGGGLVDFYADLIDILCKHSSSRIVPRQKRNKNQQQRQGDDHNGVVENINATTTTTKSQNVNINEFLEEITNHFQEKKGATNNYNGSTTMPGIPSATDLLVSSKTETTKCNDDGDDDVHDDDDDEVIAVAIPTFQAPEGFFDGKKDDQLGFVTDVEATMSLLHEAAASSTTTTTSTINDTSDGGSRNPKSIVQLSSAYLNPTNDLISSLARFDSIEILTAGRMSHGFKPKKKAGNKGKDWIPTVFDHLTAQMWDQLEQLRKVSVNEDRYSDRSLFHWEQPDWSFHAKGLWLRHSEIDSNSDDENTERDLSAAIVGSSNFGERSFKRDMESNVILIFPPSPGSDRQKQDGTKTCNILRSSLDQEWNDMKASSRRIEDPHKVVEEAPPLPWNIRLLLPFIKTFF